MMLLKRWDKQRIIMWGVILGLELVVCLYFMFFIGKLKSVKDARLTQARQELATLHNDAGQLSEMQAKYKDAQQVLAHLEPGLTPEKAGTYLPTLLAQLQSLAQQHNLKLEVVMPDPNKKVTNPAPPAAPTPPANGAGGADANAAPAPAPAPSSVTVSSGVTLTGTFPHLMAFMESLKTFPKVISVDSMQLRPKDMDSAGGISPELGVTMQISATVLPYSAEVDHAPQQQ